MKPCVFIAIHYMEIGGAEAALTGLLRAWDYDRADVELFVYSHRGELMDMIPAEVTLLPEKRSYASIESPIGNTLRRGCFGVALGRWLGKRSFDRFFHSARQPNFDAAIAHLGKSINRFLPRMSNRSYDLAISFLTPHFYVLDKVRARRKVCWIHTDYAHTSVDVELERPMWGGYDRIVSISAGVTESFCQLFPELRPKIVEIENILPVDYVCSQAKAGGAPEFEPGCFNILSVGRFCEPKNLDSVPRKLRLAMAKSGRDDLRWYIIGYGGAEFKIHEAIKREGMEGKVVVIGKRSNPYPYMAACSLYAQPSLFEGKAVTVREAQALGRPVVVSAYATASSQVEDGVDGVIVPVDDEGFADGLARIVGNEELLRKLAENCAARDYSNRAEIEKIYNLIPGPTE